jgi:hypothetical protein
MRRSLLIAAVLIVFAGTAQAQIIDQAEGAARRSLGLHQVLLGPQPTRRCCSLKGAFIGAADAALGVRLILPAVPSTKTKGTTSRCYTDDF